MHHSRTDTDSGLLKGKTGSLLFFKLLLAMVVLSSAFFNLPASAATTMKHSAPDYFVPQQRIRLETQVDDPSGIKVVRCYFKASGEADLVFVAMDMTGKNTYAGILPAPLGATTQIEYLFLAVNNNKQVVHSQMFVVTQDKNQRIPSWQEMLKQEKLKVHMELDKAPSELRGFSDNIAIDTVESGARFGVVALLYHSAAGASSKSAVAAAVSSTGATSGGTVTAGSTGWSTTAIVGVGAAAVAGGTAAAVSGGGGGSGDNDNDEIQPLTPTTILGEWSFAGTSGDGVYRGGKFIFKNDNTHDYVIKDEDETSGTIGVGTWNLFGNSLTIAFDQTFEQWIGSVSGDSRRFEFDTTSGTDHGVYDFGADSWFIEK